MAELTRTIGRYVIDRTLGQGAMGVVYLAEDPMLKRRVAIKIVRAAGEERDHALTRFQREAEISAQLNHPNIATIFDVGVEPGLGPFIAMEYVEGASLGSFIRDGSLDLEGKFGILIQVMRALRAAHRQAIVHRDVKPENILISSEGRVKLTDFGIARTMAPQLTLAGEFMGSPAYSAPELLRGGDATPCSDRYSFAVMAFELLTGQLPHPGTTIAAVISHVLTEPLVFPPGMSGDIAKVYRLALAGDPDDRPGTLMEFLVPLVNATPMDPLARERINEMFRHDDYAGDIVPLHRQHLSPPAPMPHPPAAPERPAASPATASAGGRSTPTLPVPSYQQRPAVKIELGDDKPVQARPTYHPKYGGRGGGFFTPWNLVKWFCIVLVAGKLLWWAYEYVKAHP